MRNALITLAGNSQGTDIMDLDDAGAGLYFLAAIAKEYPGAKLRDFITPEMLSGGWWSKTKNLAKDIGGGAMDATRSVGGVLGDVWRFGGESGGKAVRLLADEDVMKLIEKGSEAYANYYTYGASGAAKEGGGGLMDFLKSVGSAFKKRSSGSDSDSKNDAAGFSMPSMEKILPWAIGGVGLLLVFKMLSPSQRVAYASRR